jgi:hypothetical protein
MKSVEIAGSSLPYKKGWILESGGVFNIATRDFTVHSDLQCGDINQHKLVLLYRRECHSLTSIVYLSVNSIANFVR